MIPVNLEGDKRGIFGLPELAAAGPGQTMGRVGVRDDPGCISVKDLQFQRKYKTLDASHAHT